jgi:hypothetical protein
LKTKAITNTGKVQKRKVTDYVQKEQNALQCMWRAGGEGRKLFSTVGRASQPQAKSGSRKDGRAAWLPLIYRCTSGERSYVNTEFQQKLPLLLPHTT